MTMQNQSCEASETAAKKQVVNSVIDSATSIQLLRHLQDRVNSLKDENNRLKHSISMVGQLSKSTTLEEDFPVTKK